MIQSNRFNFQREYAKAIDKGLEGNDAYQQAIRTISFGEHRMSLGYTEFTVEIGKTGTVDLGADLGIRKDILFKSM